MLSISRPGDIRHESPVSDRNGVANELTAFLTVIRHQQEQVQTLIADGKVEAATGILREQGRVVNTALRLHRAGELGIARGAA